MFFFFCFSPLPPFCLSSRACDVLQNIMRDKWMNIGHEDDDLKPYIEPLRDSLDTNRIGNIPFCDCACDWICGRVHVHFVVGPKRAKSRHTHTPPTIGSDCPVDVMSLTSHYCSRLKINAMQ